MPFLSKSRTIKNFECLGKTLQRGMPFFSLSLKVEYVLPATVLMMIKGLCCCPPALDSCNAAGGSTLVGTALLKEGPVLRKGEMDVTIYCAHVNLPKLHGTFEHKRSISDSDGQ